MTRAILYACFLTAALLVNLVVTPSQAQADLRWVSNFQQAQQFARTQSKPMLVMFTASWCGPCKVMKKTTLSDREVEQIIGQHFIPVMIDVDANPAVSSRFEVKSMPTIMVMSAAGEVKERIVGGKSKAQFVPFLEKHKPEVHLVGATQVVAELPANQRQTARRQPNELTPYCLVAVVEDGKLVTGQTQLNSEYKGKTVRFASEESREKFLKNPEEYWPALDGNCPVTLRNTNRQVLGQARWAVEFGNQFYLCQNKELAEKFLKEPTLYVDNSSVTR